jgi:hypothetical protein
MTTERLTPPPTVRLVDLADKFHADAEELRKAANRPDDSERLHALQRRLKRHADALDDVFSELVAAEVRQAAS